jgi:hypothetical protein
LRNGRPQRARPSASVAWGEGGAGTHPALHRTELRWA